MFFATRFPQNEVLGGSKGFLRSFFAWLVRRMPNERQRLLAVTIVAGGLCGLAAVAFHISCLFLYGF